jgi:hypothetical protein
MPTGNIGFDDQLPELYTRALAARAHSQALHEKFMAVKQDRAVISQRIRNAWDEAQQLHELWLTSHSNSELLRYSAHARLRARLKSMPVIEQAKGIIMAQCGWSEDQAFDALRRASQRENIKLRDLAAEIVARAARSASDEVQPGLARVATRAREELASA